MKKISRTAARKAGRRRYFTGNLCKRGHRSQRWTANCMCIACKYEAEQRPEYRKHHHDYNKSPKGREKNRRFDETPRGHERHRAYRSSPKGRQQSRDWETMRRRDPIRNGRLNKARRDRAAKKRRAALTEN